MTGAAAVAAIAGGAEVGGSLIKGEGQKDALSLNLASQELKVQTAKTQEATKLNEVMGENLVHESVSGTALGSESYIASEHKDFENEHYDDETYDLDASIAKTNADAQRSMIDASGFETAIAATTQVGMTQMLTSTGSNVGKVAGITSLSPNAVSGTVFKTPTNIFDYADQEAMKGSIS